MKTELSRLEDNEHLFELFHLKPFDFLLEEVESLFKTQVPDTKLKTFIVSSTPQWVTTEQTEKSDSEEEKGYYTRAGVAIECEFTLESKTNTATLKGILTWVVVNLNTKPIRQMWFDKDGTLEEFGEEGELKKRIYSVNNFT